jgi:hypothetical protein
VAVNVNHRPDLRDADFAKYFTNIVQLSCAFGRITSKAFKGLESLEMLDVRCCKGLTSKMFGYLPALEDVCVYGADKRLKRAAGDRELDYWFDEEYDIDGWATKGERCTECPNRPDGGPTQCRRADEGWAACVCDHDEGTQEEIREYLCSECRAPRACHSCGEWECHACLATKWSDDEVVADTKPCAACGARVCRECALRCGFKGCTRHWCYGQGKDCYSPRDGYECRSCKRLCRKDPDETGATLCLWACEECAERNGLRCPWDDSTLNFLKVSEEMPGVKC